MNLNAQIENVEALHNIIPEVNQKLEDNGCAFKVRKIPYGFLVPRRYDPVSGVMEVVRPMPTRIGRFLAFYTQ
ncbi:MAG: hypothetical protein ACTSXJ_05125 [Candidatus Baldrarchaeia archaeon]